MIYVIAVIVNLQDAFIICTGNDVVLINDKRLCNLSTYQEVSVRLNKDVKYS